jgi:ectoine hydroxylase-related dioxygenase (phytanoyl-CoA dioxygenase family)
MSAELPRARANQPPEIEKALAEHGAVIVEGLLDSALLERFNRELDPLMAAVSPDREFLNPMVAYFFGDKTRHLTAVARESTVFSHEILTHPTYQAVCDAILLESCSAYILNIATVMDRGPGSEQQLLHRDEDVWPHLPRPHKEVQLASVIALTDFDADNGATRIVPGSHRWERNREAQADEIAVAEMRAGDAVIYLGSAIHAGGANTTEDRGRRGMHVSFCAGWLRTEENHYLSVPLDTIRDMPERAQALLGYAAHDAIADGGGYLGTVDLVDPISLIQDGRL